MYKAFYQNGKVKEEGLYNQGNKTGKWFYYDAKGKKTKIKYTN
jgi:antitoxin component YwqK of YwqJK toxin-antitoxin module